MPKAVPIQTNFTAGELSPRLDGRVDLDWYHGGCRRIENFVVHPQGGASRRSGFRFLAEAKDPARKMRLIPFEFSVEQAYILEFGHLYMRVFKDRGQVTDGGAAYEIATPYEEGDLSGIQYTQSADVLYLAHTRHAPRKLTRTGHAAWTLSLVNFGAPVNPPSSLAATPTGSGGTTHRYVATGLDGDLRESNASAEATCLNAAALNSSAYNTLTWTAAAGVSEYGIYKERNGIFGRIGRAAGTSFVDKGEVSPPDIETTPPVHHNPFAAEGDYPAAVTFFEQRLCWAGTRNHPVTIWLSKTGDFENLDRSSPARDDDACEFALNADRINLIRWLSPGRDLLAGTAGGEWRLSGANGNPISPVSVEARRESRHGSAEAMPLAAGGALLFLDRSGRRVREFAYSLESDGYVAPDLNIRAEHLTRNAAITDWAWQASPPPTVWCVRSDGALLGLTYQPDQKVFGWHRHVTAGWFESVAAIPGPDRDELWAAVRREVNGETRRFIELLEGEFQGDDTSGAFFVDAGLTYSGPPASVISGLEHLAGATVAVLADGAVLPDRVVSAAGTIALERLAGVVHVGLPFVSTLETMRIEAGAADGTSQGRIKRIAKVTVRVERTLGLKAGPDRDHLESVAFRSSADPLGRPPALFTGDKDITWPGGYETEGRLTIVQDQALPLTVLAVVPRVDTSGR